jgi:acetoin utilization protein AcuB
MMEASPTRTAASPPPAVADAPIRPLSRVGEVIRAASVKVPSWFSAAAALRVARLKRADHLMVLDRQQLVGSVSAQALAAVPGGDPVGRWMNPSRLTVSPEAFTGEARRLMNDHGLECLPVVSGALFLGVVCRSDLC